MEMNCLSRIFKKEKGVSPSVFQKQWGERKVENFYLYNIRGQNIFCPLHL